MTIKLPTMCNYWILSTIEALHHLLLTSPSTHQSLNSLVPSTCQYFYSLVPLRASPSTHYSFKALFPVLTSPLSLQSLYSLCYFHSLVALYSLIRLLTSLVYEVVTAPDSVCPGTVKLVMLDLAVEPKNVQTEKLRNTQKESNR